MVSSLLLTTRSAHLLVGSVCSSIFLILTQSDLCLNGHFCRKPSQTPLSQQQLYPPSVLQPCHIFLQSTCPDLILIQKIEQRRCGSSINWRQASRVLYLLLPFPLLSHLSLPVLEPREDKIPTSTESFLSHGGRLCSYTVCRMLCFYGPLIKLWDRILPQQMLEAEQKTRLEIEKCITHWTGEVRQNSLGEKVNQLRRSKKTRVKGKLDKRAGKITELHKSQDPRQTDTKNKIT